MDFDREDLLKQLGAIRQQLIEVRTTLRPRSGLARCVDGVVDEIDELALVLTGKREYFHAPGAAAQMRGK